jgi:hypothetical protein
MPTAWFENGSLETCHAELRHAPNANMPTRQHDAFGTGHAGRAGAHPYHTQTRTTSRAKRQHADTPTRCFWRRATPDARERIPTTPRRELRHAPNADTPTRCFWDGPRRTRGSAFLPSAFNRKNCGPNGGLSISQPVLWAGRVRLPTDNFVRRFAPTAFPE